MLQQEQPRDYVIATGRQYSVRQFVDAACRCLELPLEWQGDGIDARGVNPKTGAVFVAVDPRYFR